MALTPNLRITLPESGQINKELIIAVALEQLEMAVAGIFDYDYLADEPFEFTDGGSDHLNRTYKFSDSNNHLSDFAYVLFPTAHVGIHTVINETGHTLKIGYPGVSSVFATTIPNGTNRTHHFNGLTGLPISYYPNS